MAEVSLPSLEWLRKQLQEADPDLLRAMVESVVATLMGAEADALCGASYGERHPERTNRRNGYRERPWDTRLGTLAVPIPKLRHGSYFPEWLLEPRRRAERALVQVVAEAYLLGVSVRRIETLVQTLGIDRLSKSRVAEMPGSSTSWSRPSAPGRSTPAPMPTSGSMPRPSAAGMAAASSTSPPSPRSASMLKATARSWAATSSPPRTAPAGPPSCATSSRAA
jgi:hypothetical protein